MKTHQICQVQERKVVIELDFWEILIMIPCLLIGLSPAWFAFTKSTRVRWMVGIGWWSFGLLLVFGNFHGIGDSPPPIVLIGYPIGIVIRVSSGQVFIKLSGGSVFGYGDFFAKESEPKMSKVSGKSKDFSPKRLIP